MVFLAPKSRNIDLPHTGLALGLAAICLGQALHHGNGFINVIALFYLTISLIFLSWAFFGRPIFGSSFFAKLTFPLLLLGLLLQIYQLAFAYFGDLRFLSLVPSLWQFRVGILIAGGLAVASLTMQRQLSFAAQNGLTILVLLTLWFSGTWLIKHVPYPFIDVFVFQQNSSRVLLDGGNPYLLTAPYIYGDLVGYSAELVRDEWFTFGAPYPPLSIYLSSLGYIFGGDIRYSHLLAFLLSGALIAFLHPGRGSRLAAYLFLFTSRSFYVIEMSWTEPLVIFLFAATVYCAIHHPRWLVVPVGLLVIIKQYILFFTPLLLLILPAKNPRLLWARQIVGIVILGLLVSAPLAFWDLPSFLWNVGGVHLKQSFRLDALTYLAMYARIFDALPSQWIGFAVLLLSFYFVWRFMPRTPEGFAASFAWCLILFIAFNKQAFCNYYFLVIGAMTAALSALSPKLIANFS